MAVKKFRELKTNNNVAVRLPFVTIFIKSFQERFDKVFRSTYYQLDMALHPNLRLSLFSDD